MDSNYFSCLYVAYAVLNRWLRPSAGTKADEAAAPPVSITTKPFKASLPRHLIFTSSFVSFLTFAGYAPYFPSKLALRSLAESLAQEMHLYAGAHPSLPRVRIHIVYPATIKTSGYEAENLIKTDITKMLEDGDEGESAAECASTAIKGLESGAGVVTTRWMTWAVWCAGLGASERRGWAEGILVWAEGYGVGEEMGR
ncbi:MAG: hypothetical protein M1821_001899 [Bathelium mastoideum]|nr:MAG: hypothetical protein M1821_001899 [Bathelium mastoideum]